MPNDESIFVFARVFKIAPEKVFKIVHALPIDRNEDPWVEEMSHKLTLLPDNLRGVAGKFIDSMIEGEEASEKKDRKARKNSKSTAA